MEKLIKIIKKLYWLGLLGFVGTFFDISFLQLFYLFFLLAILDFIISFIIVIKTEHQDENISSLKFVLQNFAMLFGIPIIYLRNFFRIPNIKTYKPQNLYSLPFEGCWLVANGGIDKFTSHSWSICNQRYAYDFLIVENDKSFINDGKSVVDYYCYGKKILAPADGVVVDIKNLFADTPISDQKEVLCSSSDIRGNYIVIKHSDNEYSMIAHIKKDSFSVKIGDTVKRGQLLACCGNSGNTSEPHIHFQIQQGSNFLLSASLPICFVNIKNYSEPGNQYISQGQLVENQK